MVDVTGKWALITGSSRGIGRLLAKFMAKQGCHLILHSSRMENTEAIEKEVQSLGVQTHRVAADLGDAQAVAAMLDELEAWGHPVEIVFNNAGVQVGYREDFWQTPLADFEKSFQVNFTSVAMICYRLIPAMVKRGFGRVVNTTSGIRDQPEQAGYSASKAALDKFTKDIATKLEGTNVQISLTDPGWCRTDLGGQQAPNDPESSLPGVAVGAFIDDRKSGRFFGADRFHGMCLEEAVAKAETFERAD